MTDRPSLGEMIDAVRMHLETALLPVARPDPRLYFQTLVALNLLKIAQREVASGPEIRRAEWEGLNRLVGSADVEPKREAELVELLGMRYRSLRSAIRAGEYDSAAASDRLLAFLEPVVAAQLVLNNPGLARRIGEEIKEETFAE